MGRPKYETHVKPKLMLIEAWARDGLTMEQIAHNLGIDRATLFRYQKQHCDLRDALKRGREEVDVMVENALLKAALGYEYEEEAVTHKGEVVTLRKYMPPNTTALIFWLKNRRPDRWRDKRDVEHSGTVSLAEVLTRAWEEDADGGDSDQAEQKP